MPPLADGGMPPLADGDMLPHTVVEVHQRRLQARAHLEGKASTAVGVHRYNSEAAAFVDRDRQGGPFVDRDRQAAAVRRPAAE